MRSDEWCKNTGIPSFHNDGAPLVEVRYKNGAKALGRMNDYRWEILNNSYDIIEYRIIEAAPVKETYTEQFDPSIHPVPGEGLPILDKYFSVQETLNARGSRYGDFTTNAALTQALKDVMWAADGWVKLTPVQRQGLEVIMDKVARILNGDPNYADNWHDIQGYAKLVEERLPKERP